MGGTLLITGGDDHARSVFRSGRAYWSGAFHVVLEKHGYLSLLRAGPEALAHPETWERYDVVLVASLPDRAWTPEVARAALAGRAGVIVEGPLPTALAEELGVRREPAPSQTGVLSTVDATLHAAGSRFGYPPSGRVEGSTSYAVPRDPALDWTQFDDVGITEAQAAAWRASSWDVERWIDPGDLSPIATWTDAQTDERWPIIGRSGNLVACGFGLLTFLVQRHTSEPFTGPEHRNAARSAGIEHLLLSIVDDLHARAGASRARVLPWPDGVRWVRTVRHDFDRPLSAPDVARVLLGHQRAGSAATWYWRSRHAPSAALSAVAVSPRHEVALHTELLWGGSGEERLTLERALGRAIHGSSAHGDPQCFRYQGAPNVLWAEKERLEYTELVHQAHFHPHRFVALGADGAVRAVPVVCLPHHESLDRSTTPGDTNTERIWEMLPVWIETRGLLQVMNHPDQNTEELFSLLRAMPAAGRADWTAQEAAKWWRRTHVADELRIRPTEDDFEVLSRRGVTGLVVEILDPDGTRHEHVVDARGAVPARVRAGRAPRRLPDVEELRAFGELRLDSATTNAPKDVAAGLGVAQDGLPSARRSREPTGGRWQRASERFRAVISTYLSGQGVDLDGASAQTTLRTNAELVPNRAADLALMARVLGGVPTLAGLDVAELGCGWGALATYLALRYEPRSLHAVDIREDFVQAAAEIALTLDVPSLSFSVADMATLDNLSDGAFDVVLANNAFIYLPERGRQREALRSIRRVLRPGGSLVIYGANRWTPREPFTGAPLIHLVPGPLVRPVSRMTGLSHSHGRVRYVSPPDMLMLLRSAGFSDVRFGAPRADGIETRRRGWFARFYGVGARVRA